MKSKQGIPRNWETVEEWLDNDSVPSYPLPADPAKLERKYKDIPLLEDYSSAPEESFWKNFPRRELPKKAVTRINVKNFGKLVEKYKPQMTRCQTRRAETVLEDLKHGANSYQKSRLPPLATPNAKTAIEHGALLTDKIAGWIEAGFVAGPFDSPPVKGFRANPLMAVVRNGKVRPVLNMSGPRGRSFNDNVAEEKLEKVHMATAKSFGYFLRDKGKNAIFSKFDYGDAYKTIPSKPEDYYLQGFMWMGKWFIETQQIFGGIPSVCNFDREGNTIQVWATLESKVPQDSVRRILDDTSHICRAGSKDGERFCEAMKKICGFINMPLAANCPKHEKAFELVTRGVVMGVGFDSSDLTWYLTKEKSDKVVSRCLDVAQAKMVDLKQMEKVMGSVNDLAQMASFLRFYKANGNSFLQSFNGNYDILRWVPSPLKEDMLVVAKVAVSAQEGLPICSKPSKPPLSTLHLYTDAAGASFSMVDGIKTYHSNLNKGVACVAGEDLSDIWKWCRMDWPGDWITDRTDDMGKSFGSKSTFLESCGLLLPFFAFPNDISGRYVCFHVDNIAVYYGWRNGAVKFDKYSTGVLRAVQLLASFTGTYIYVKHVPRMSNDMAELADSLSRRSEDPRVDRKLQVSVLSSLSDWLTGDLCPKDFPLHLLRLFKESM